MPWIDITGTAFRVELEMGDLLEWLYPFSKEPTVTSGHPFGHGTWTSKIVSSWPPRIALESILTEIEEHLRCDPENIECLFLRACIFWQLGRFNEAEQGYREVLERVPNHFGALSRLGIALRQSGLPLEARVVFEKAVRHHPGNAVGHVNLANSLAATDATAAREHYETALRLQPELLEAHQGLSSLLALLGEEEDAKRHRERGFKGRSIVPSTYRGTQKPIPVLLLRSTTGGNIDTSPFLDDRTFLVFQLFADAHDQRTPLPPHELVVNGIGDADRAREALVAAERLLRYTVAPAINPPRAVLATGRVENARRFAAVPGVVTPNFATLLRSILDGPDAQAALSERGFAYPLLIRPPGHHLGRNFVKVDCARDLFQSLKGLPGDEVFVIEYLDARWADGKVRKYRVMMIDDKLYPVHLAISREWKVHYFSAETSESSEHRVEEERFLRDMPGTLGPRATDALLRIQAMLGLDYAGIDFGLNAAGEILFFEANAAMTLYKLPDDARSAYRVAPNERVLVAARDMILNRVRSRSTQG